MTTDFPKVQLFIDGQWRQTAETLPLMDPATDETIGHVPIATMSDLDDALAAAERGFRHWSTMGVDKRTPILKEAVRLLRERAQQIGEIMSREQGKPVAEGRAEVMRSAALLEWDIEESRRIYGKVIPGATGTTNLVVRVPVGPVAAFTPWNFPASIPARKLGALAAGCSIVLKPAEETPATACAMVQCFADAGLPPGVLNLVFGNPVQISEYFIDSPVIKLVTLTGSVPVGKTVAARAASRMKPSVMELGGHAPVIICEDADFSAIGEAAVLAKFRNAGQICTCPTRFIVHKSGYDAFLAAFVKGTEALRIGCGSDPETQMGPLANARRVKAMTDLVSDAVDAGARLVTGGRPIEGPGTYFQPTILADVPTHARAMEEEPFGPIALVVPFDSLDDAITIANSVPYGLASYAFTDSAKSIFRLTQEIEAGLLSINHFGASQPEGPFGGVGESGLGQEGGQEGLLAFTNLRYVQIR